MTAAEACGLLVQTIHALSDTRAELAAALAERDAWKLLACQAIHHSADLTQQLEVVDRRLYIHRRRLEDQAPDETARRQEAA